MTYKLKRQLKRLDNKQFTQDIKSFIRSSHNFYGEKVPELKTLAKRLHEEYSLKEFYKVFNRFWKSGYQGEKSLAINTLQLYKEEFDLNTWKFIKSKMNDIKSTDQAESIGKEIVGNLLIKYPKLDREIIRLAKSKNLWFNEIAISSTLPLIKKQNTKLAIYLCEIYLNNTNEQIRKIVGKILREISIYKPETAKRFILKHNQMNDVVFKIATENLKDLRKIRKVKKLKRLEGKWFFTRLFR